MKKQKRKFITKEGFDFKFNPQACRACKGNCCNGESGIISVDGKEAERISAFLKIDLSELIGDYLRRDSYKFTIKELKIDNSYFCVFFDHKTNRCSIYPVRPAQCETFPFWDYFKDNREILTKECPGVVD